MLLGFIAGSFVAAVWADKLDGIVIRIFTFARWANWIVHGFPYYLK